MGVTDTSGTLLEKLYYNTSGLCRSYDATVTPNLPNLRYGTSYNIGRSIRQPFGYLGVYRDRFTGLYHTHFRDYDPVHSRWLSEDPAGYADGLNLNAAYMDVNGVDPLGLGVFGQIMTWLGTGGDCWPESEKADDMAYIKAIGKGAHEGKENIVSGCVDTAGSVVDCWTYGDTNYGGLDDKFVNTGTALEVTCYENNIQGAEYYYLMTSGLLADSTFLGTIEKGVAGSEIIYGEGQLDGTRDLNLLVRTWDIAWGTTEGVLTYYGTKDLFTGVKSGKIGTESSVDDVLKPGNTKPLEPYNRTKHYGNTPTRADRKALGASKNQVVDHDPPLVKRYYEGDLVNGERPGYTMTEAERRASAIDRSRMKLQDKADSNLQGGQMSQYSKKKRGEHGL